MSSRSAKARFETNWASPCTNAGRTSSGAGAGDTDTGGKYVAGDAAINPGGGIADIPENIGLVVVTILGSRIGPSFVTDGRLVVMRRCPAPTFGLIIADADVWLSVETLSGLEPTLDALRA